MRTAAITKRKHQKPVVEARRRGDLVRSRSRQFDAELDAIVSELERQWKNEQAGR